MSATLLLNSDGAPVSVIPLSVISWKDAIGYLVSDTATVLEWHDNWVVHSARWQNVFLRDGYTCQYCGTSVTKNTATLDHVIPVNHNIPGLEKGKSTFENTVCACGTCNANKGNNHKIVPKVKPVKPTYYQLVAQRKKLPFELHHPSWALYLGIDS
jgi:5-methylcytosine-specific restriction endonuclease McrA